jgi:hypothetical protein
MVDRAFPHHAANRSLQYPFLLFFYSYPSYQRRIRRISFVTFVESNANALLTAVPSIKSALAPCRGLVVPSGHSIIAATTPQFLYSFPSFLRDGRDDGDDIFYIAPV